MSLHTSSQRIPVSSVSFSAGACITNNEESSASMMFSMMANESLPQKEIECITIEDDDSEEEAYQSPFNDNSGDSAYGHDHYDDGFASYVQETRESYQSFEGDSKSLIVQNLLHGTYAGESFAVSNLNASLPQRMNTSAPGTYSASNSLSGTPSLPNLTSSSSTTSDNVIPFILSAEMNHRQSAQFSKLSRQGYAMEQEIADGWSKKSGPAISSFCTKSSSTSSTSSSCSLDFDLVNSPEAHSHDHDASPDSPDSGVSGSVNSADDLKHMEEDDDEHEHLSLQLCTTGRLETTCFSPRPALLPGKHSGNLTVSAQCELALEESPEMATLGSSFCGHDSDKSAKLEKTLTVVNQLTATSKSSVITSHINLKAEFCCKWHDCDWPGHYEELPEHIREIHVALQPFLDVNGKVINWIKPKHKRQTNDDEDDDETPFNSDQEDDDDEMASDNESISSSIASSRITRRSGRGKVSSPFCEPKLTRHKQQQQQCEDQAEQKYVCLWKGCRVYGKPSFSKPWLERHALEMHSGPKPFKCIWEGCAQRFKNQSARERHVNSHLRQANMVVTSTPNSNGPSRRQSEVTTDVCCNCSCHSCDTESTSQPATARLDKSRCDSTDSAISLTSASSEYSLPSTSRGVYKSSASSSSSTSSSNEHCHTPNCCKQSTTELNPLFLKARKKMLRLQKEADSEPLENKFDYFGDYATDYTLRILKTRAFRITRVKSAYNKYARIHDGKHELVRTREEKRNNNCILLNPIDPENGADLVDEASSTAPKSNAPKEDTAHVFNKRLFKYDQKFTFVSEIILAHRSSNDNLEYQIQWHPRGFLEDEWIKPGQLAAKRTRSLRITPKLRDFLKEQKECHSLERSDSELMPPPPPKRRRKE